MQSAPDHAIFACVAPLLGRIPEWIRHDLGSKEAHVRTSAEEALALMIEAAIRAES